MTASVPANSEPGEESLAGLWSYALQALAARAAHEINNALNGVAMNVAVVQARARPGGDAGALAPFAGPAAEQVEVTSALIGALLALARAPRGAADVAEVARQVATLLAPAVAVEGARGAATAADPLAVRLAVTAALLAVVDQTAETAGPQSADGPERVVRCIIRADAVPELEIAPRSDAELPAATVRALAGAGVTVSHSPDALRLAFPPPAAHL